MLGWIPVAVRWPLGSYNRFTFYSQLQALWMKGLPRIRKAILLRYEMAIRCI